MSNANSPFAERTDVLLADLPTSLDALAVAPDRIVLVVASEASTTLPCCNQSLGYKNQQISKLWTATHWKSEKCKELWKGVHILCVRKLRKNSAYATEQDVRACLGDRHAWVEERFLHRLTSKVPPATVVRTSGAWPPLAAVRASATNATPTTGGRMQSARQACSESPNSGTEDISPIDASKRQRGLKGRASDPLLYGANATRSPIVTRKKSGVLKPDPASKIGYASGTAASETRCLSNAVTQRTGSVASTASPPLRVVQRKRSATALTSAAPSATAPRASSVLSRVASTGSAIPTPVARRISAPLLSGTDSHSSAFDTPTGAMTREAEFIDATDATEEISSSNAGMPHQSPSAEASRREALQAAQELARLRREMSTLTALTRDLELENARLKKQKASLGDETDQLKKRAAKVAQDLETERKATAAAREGEKRLRLQIGKLKVSSESARTAKAKVDQLEAELAEGKRLNASLEAQLKASEAEHQLKEEGLEEVAETPASTEQTQSDLSALVSAFSPTLTPPTSPPKTPLRLPVGPPAAVRHSSSPSPADRSLVFVASPLRTPRAHVRTPLGASARRTKKKDLGVWQRLVKRRLSNIGTL